MKIAGKHCDGKCAKRAQVITLCYHIIAIRNLCQQESIFFRCVVVSKDDYTAGTSSTPNNHVQLNLLLLLLLLLRIFI